MPNIQAVAQKPRTVNSECVVIFTRKKMWKIKTKMVGSFITS